MIKRKKLKIDKTIGKRYIFFTEMKRKKKR